MEWLVNDVGTKWIIWRSRRIKLVYLCTLELRLLSVNASHFTGNSADWRLTTHYNTARDYFYEEHTGDNGLWWLPGTKIKECEKLFFYNTWRHHGQFWISVSAYVSSTFVRISWCRRIASAQDQRWSQPLLLHARDPSTPVYLKHEIYPRFTKIDTDH